MIGMLGTNLEEPTHLACSDLAVVLCKDLNPHHLRSTLQFGSNPTEPYGAISGTLRSIPSSRDGASPSRSPRFFYSVLHDFDMGFVIPS